MLLNYYEMTEAESKEATRHFLLYELADLILAEGYDSVMTELSEILDDKLDRLEPC